MTIKKIIESIKALFWSGWGVELEGVDKEHPIIVKLAELREEVLRAHEKPDLRSDDPIERHLGGT